MKVYLRGFCRGPFAGVATLSSIFSQLFKEREILPDVVTSSHSVCMCTFSQSLNQQADFNKNVTLTPLEVTLKVSV